MSKIKTYGEIQYYLYDGDKKEKKVTKDSFMNSKGANGSNISKPPQQTTTSLTGKVIESFEEFCNEFNGANLPLNDNPRIDTTFDGGDGNSATDVPRKFVPTVKDNKPKKGNNARKKQEEYRKKYKKYSKETRLARTMDYQTTDDLITFAPRTQPTVNAGGRSTA